MFTINFTVIDKFFYEIGRKKFNNTRLVIDYLKRKENGLKITKHHLAIIDILREDSIEILGEDIKLLKGYKAKLKDDINCRLFYNNEIEKIELELIE